MSPPIRANMKIIRVLMLIVIGAGAWGQAPPPPARSPNSDRRIMLDVVVTDKSRNPVSGLEQSDFTVLDDKQTETILSFRASEESRKDSRLQGVFFFVAATLHFTR